MSKQSSPDGTVWGGADPSEKFLPFAGRWAFISHKYEDPQVKFGIARAPDLIVNGHIVQFGEGTYAQQLRLCNVHVHGDVLCGEGWRITDLTEPWKKSRLQFTMKLEGDEILLRERTIPHTNAVSDAEPVFAPDDFQCTAEANIETDLPWAVFRYSRKSSK